MRSNQLMSYDDPPEYCDECGNVLGKHFKCASCAADEADRQAECEAELLILNKLDK